MTRIPRLKGSPGTGRGAAITPGLLLTAGEGGGRSSEWRARVGGESSGCRRSGGSLPGAQLMLEAEAPTGLRTPRGAAGALGKAGSLPGAGPAQPRTLCWPRVALAAALAARVPPRWTHCVPTSARRPCHLTRALFSLQAL